MSTSNQRRRIRKKIQKDRDNIGNKALMEMGPDETVWKIINDVIKFGAKMVGTKLMTRAEAYQIRREIEFGWEVKSKKKNQTPSNPMLSPLYRLFWDNKNCKYIVKRVKRPQRKKHSQTPEHN